MFKYDKKLPFPINIKKKDLRMAKAILTQYGGPYCKRYSIERTISNELQIFKTKNR